MLKKLFLAFMLPLSINGFGQTIYQESFETNTNGTNYNTSIAEFSDGFNDFFTRTDGSSISSSYAVSNIDGSFYFAGMDIDGEGASLPVNLTTIPISVAGLSSIDFSILLAEDDDGTNEDWDETDYVHITYSVDGGASQNLIWIENDGSQFNGAPLIDTDFDGVGDGTEITSTFTNFTETIALSGASSIVFSIEFNLDAGDEDLAIDNINVSTNPSGPIIIAAPNSLSGFQQFVGSPSTEQSIDVSGSSLTADIDVDVTAGDYEISLTSGAGFGSTLTLPQTGGTVNTTTIYVRLNGTAAQSPANGDITLTSAGATNQVVSLSGNIFPPDPIVFVTPSSLSNFSQFVGTPSAEQSIEVSGSFLTNDVIVTAPTNYEVSLTSGSNFSSSIALTPSAGSVSATTVYVRLNGTTANASQTGDITIASTGAISETVSLSGITQDYVAYTIGEVTTNDANLVPDSLNVYVELNGIVHCIDYDGNDGISFVMIDGANDGIAVFNFSDVDGYVVTEGDSITVRGQIQQFNGLTQVFAEGITLNSQGNPIQTPDVVTALDESTESQFITLENLTFVNGDANWPTNGNVDVTNGTMTYSLRVESESPLSGAATPNGPFNATGLGWQFDSSGTPYDSGYQMYPCSVSPLCNLDLTISSMGETIEANAAGASYQWVDCDDNFSPIAGETNQAFTATENGNYAVIITDGQCTDTTDCTTINTIGLASEHLKLDVYPNPVQNTLTIDAQGSTVNHVKVVSVTGQQIDSLKGKGEKSVLNTSNWKSGVYFVEVSTTKGSKIVKVIK
jgi:DNA/RNA endonuclease YhcR with UshA esterase domain